MDTSRAILKLLYKSSGWLLRFSFYALPIALFFSISSYLFIDKVLSSYERYLINSYIGIQGRVSVETNDKKLIKGLVEFSQSQKLKYSLKKELKTTVTFLGEIKLPKYAKFIVLDQTYMQQKFNNLHANRETLFVNDVFLNSMGSLDKASFNKLYFNDDKKLFDINGIERVDTGFLSSEPIVFISAYFAKEIFGDIQKEKEVVEYLENSDKSIKTIKQTVKQLAMKYKTLQIKVHDLILDTQDTKEFFEKTSIIQKAISILIFMLSVGIILLSISVSIEFKKNSLKTLQLIGMSSRDLALTISVSIFFMIVIILGLSLLCQSLFENLFLHISGFSDSFFIAQDYTDIYIIIALGMTLFAIAFSTTTYIFKR